MADQSHHLPPIRSLSGRLLLLTIIFVLVGEVLIYVPSIGRFRATFLQERIATAHLATLSLEAAGRRDINTSLENELLAHAGVLSITLHELDAELMLGRLPPVEKVFDLRLATPSILLMDAFEVLLNGGDRTVRVMGPSPQYPAILVDISLRERAMWNAMVDYSWRILTLSIVLSLITAVSIYLALHLIIVLPLRRITESVIAFRRQPENASNLIPRSDRRDEIGVVQAELASMQRGLRAALAQKTRLAALGAAVSKINHDLRNLLANAMLLSDSLDVSEDPSVKQIAPRIVRSMERAAKLCGDTLSFSRAQVLEPRKARFLLRPLIDDVGEAIMGPNPGPVRWKNDVDEMLQVDADRDQLFRVVMNLGRNAQLAMAGTGGLIAIDARQGSKHLILEIADTGPGIPNEAKDHLFKAFAGSTRPGGTGLGLAIAQEIMRAHGGEIELLASSADGTTFRLSLPSI